MTCARFPLPCSREAVNRPSRWNLKRVIRIQIILQIFLVQQVG